MQKFLIAGSLLALSIPLTGCDRSSPSQDQSSATAAPIKWDKTSVQQLEDTIARRAAHGLDHMAFPIEGQPGSAEGEKALTQSALRYARAVSSGAADPTKIHDVYTLPRHEANLDIGVAEAMADGKFAEWIDDLAPQNDQYRALSKAYLSLRGTPEKAPLIANTDTLKPGSSDPRIPAIAAQLVASDYLERRAVQGNQYGPDLVRAVKRMQADYGIEPDGVIGADAFEILNLSDADRAREIAVAMERMRWLNRAPAATRIDVNLATARLFYWRDGKMVDTRKVVVGKPEHETPQLGSPIYRLVANPTWTVPRSIEKREIASKGADYLRRNNMAWKDGWIVQQPGPQNSLGQVKFDMKNDHEIFLHDTPAKQLFTEVQRQRSHGCVRIDDALGFAEILARDMGVLDQWKAARATGKETFVALPREIPVRLTYQTIVFDDAGNPVIRADPYGWNGAVAAALGFAERKGHILRTSGDDVGP